MKKHCLIAAHDAGGAEVVSAWVLSKSTEEYRFTFLLEGPALSTFKRKIPDIEIASRNEIFPQMAQFDFVLTGSGWSSDLELQTIKLAREKSVFVAAYLDHWDNYAMRFEMEKRPVRPDEFWVGDDYSMELAKKCFPETKIKFERNMYFEEMLASISKFSPPPKADPSKIRILYICEPVTSQEATEHQVYYFGYTEFEALTGYLEHLKSTQEQGRIEMLRIRPHPSEPKNKYLGFIDKYQDSIPIETGYVRPLAEDCAWADWIVGCESMALAIGVFSKKKVFSCIPKGKKKISLPFREIEKIFE